MKLLKLKFILLLGSLFMILFGLIFCVTLFFSDDDSSAQDSSDTSGLSVSKEVLSHKNTVEKYCKEYDISKYVHYILAIMQVESGGKGQDVMQSSGATRFSISI